MVHILNKINNIEQGPIRPPNEASSLLIRLTRNCPWNKCLFCPVYKNEKFSRRSLNDVLNDINNIEVAVKYIYALSESCGLQGNVNQRVLSLIQDKNPELLQIATWLYNGGENVFLQDGDSLLMPYRELVEILKAIKSKFKSVKRITTYSRSKTILRRSLEELLSLKKEGLSRVHVGLESGNDQVLEFMKKGVNSKEHIEAGKRIKAAGLSLSEYVILGLGGRKLWKEHACDTAYVLNEINPDYIRLRTLAVPKISPLYSKVESGAFSLLDDDQVIEEEYLFIKNLEVSGTQLYSDHILNLLEEVRGKLPDQKKDMLDTINRYLSLNEEKRDLFKLGRRTGYFRLLSDTQNSSLRMPVEQLYRQLQNIDLSVDQYIQQQMLRFI